MGLAEERLDKDGEWGKHLWEAARRGRISRLLSLLRDMVGLSFVRRLWKLLYVPRHVAFIMDGNRRWAKQNGLKTLDGHSCGFDSLVRLLEWSLELRVETVTVYAFSILNFNRPKEEVDGLMDLAATKFNEFLQVKSFVMRKNVRVRVIGNLELLPDKLKQICGKLMVETAGNSRATLNVCLPYTAGEEMTTAVKRLVTAVRNDVLLPEDIDQQFFMRCLYTREAGSPEILVRTSGEIRLSDFLIWQARFSHLYFLRTFWPQITIWHMLWCILDYQTKVKQHFKATSESLGSSLHCALNKRKIAFLEKLQEEEEVKYKHWAGLAT